MNSNIEETNLIIEIKQAAIDHLNTNSAKEALSHFTNDIVAVSNDKFFTSYDSLAEDVNRYYEILKEVNYAQWDDIQIKIINHNAATFTAKFRYTFTTIENERIDLSGIWTALFVRDNGHWKIRLRHESFSSHPEIHG
ncbi:MAG: nuclear transport factor 2 family protein [Calditrichia bacterium]|nr:nuclear transport factor 2 family protein [Calditrichia bacterium]